MRRSPGSLQANDDKRIRKRLRDDLQHYAAKCLRIRTKAGSIEPLTLNRVQRHLHERLERQRKRTGKIRAIVLKGRQQGCSTYVEARLYHRVTPSWAETLFMFHAPATRMVFFGFSMSDPNMRRWLALSNQSALQDLYAMKMHTEMTPRHIWLTTHPGSSLLTTLGNEALFHLGVRPGWMADWSQTEPAFCNLLAL